MFDNVEIRTKVLSRLQKPEDYKIYKAGLDWDLTDPIVIESAEDFKSTPQWKDRLIPFHHQVSNLITFCRRLPVTLLADDVGLGKTISAGLIISELVARGRLKKILVVCPKLLCPQWQDELKTKFGIKSQIATGRALLTANPDDVGAVITTYNSARIYLDDIPEDRFEMLILDEAHKLRNLYGVPQTPKVATKFRKALEARRFRFVLMLTATPIQNRLWDLYSLVDLLTVARGHENPFGKEGIFARRFIADEKDKARQLKADAKDEFRAIVYNYMSRVRRDDAKLSFPVRKVQMHRVNPTPAELELINVIAEPIQRMNRLAQISILQALASSPDALSKQLQNMARNGTAPAKLSVDVKAVVDNMPRSAKLEGLAKLIETLKKQSPDRWRMVVFTTRRETQTTIQAFLEEQGLKVGIINGDSGDRNQATIQGFRKNPPDCHVIVSTEAGSEGVNLQVANVLVNFDLPWNPMIVEQRIGRVQRLGSEFAHVSILNMMLIGTFEEYIVGRLTEKLQMAAHAIGDLESLLQGSDVGEGEDDGSASFEDKILDLVLKALAGKDVAKAVRLEEASIEEARKELEREEANINTMLGGMDGAEYVGPRAPTLPAPIRSMDARSFTLGGLPFVGARVSSVGPDLFLAEEKTSREYICFKPLPDETRKTTVYSESAPAFLRLVKRVTASGIHNVKDLDVEPARACEKIARKWVEDFGGTFGSARVSEVKRSFGGIALIKVRASVAHDSYERIVACQCDASEHTRVDASDNLEPVPSSFEDASVLGLDLGRLKAVGTADEAIAEFCRFYLERRERELKSAGSDSRKRKKLEDDFTPNLQMTLVGLEGDVFREVKMQVKYTFGPAQDYESEISITPRNVVITTAPAADLCTLTGRMVPRDCLAKCEMTGAEVLRHLLVKSEATGRTALPEFAVRCALSGKQVLGDEVEKSSVTGNFVLAGLLKESSLSGKRGEPHYFGTCSFTNATLLNDELSTSSISGKAYRTDEQETSSVSGRTGHKREFVECYETRRPIARTEGEQCAATGRFVRKGVLERCAQTGKRVLSRELGECAVSGMRVLKNLLVESSISQISMIESNAVRSRQGKFCLPAEAVECFWSARTVHPDDIRTCELTGLPIYVEFCAPGKTALRPLVEMLDGRRRTADEMNIWKEVTLLIASVLKKKNCRIESAVKSPAGTHLATCSEIKSLLGMRTRQAGAIYDLVDQSVVGWVKEGARQSTGWRAR